jgi:cellulose synthase/poly-beta-1,6-N-acetylglucosamine synthase-like glycosyltransferase
MKITIIVCAYRSEKFIEGALNHLLKLKYPNKEIIVAVDTEEDNTYQKVLKFKNKVKITYSKKRRGIVTAFNDALKKATGDIIVKVDTEYRFISKNPLQKIAAHYKNPNVGALTFSSIRFSKYPKYFTRLVIAEAIITRVIEDWRNEKYPIIKDYFPCPIFIHSFRNVVKKIDENTINDDAEFAYKILDMGYELRFVNDVILHAFDEPLTIRDIFNRQRRTACGWFITKQRRKISLRFYYLSLIKYYILHIKKYGIMSIIYLLILVIVYSVAVMDALIKGNVHITEIWKRR